MVKTSNLAQTQKIPEASTLYNFEEKQIPESKVSEIKISSMNSEENP